MTPRHVQAARLHNSKSVKASSTGERQIRPGMSDWHIAIGQLVHRCAGDLAEHRSEPRTILAGRIVEWVNVSRVKIPGRTVVSVLKENRRHGETISDPG